MCVYIYIYICIHPGSARLNTTGATTFCLPKNDRSVTDHSARLQPTVAVFNAKSHNSFGIRLKASLIHKGSNPQGKAISQNICINQY